MAIGRAGIRSILPAGLRLISGPGCPVCVTPPGVIDAAAELAEQGVILATFGDMLRVPGSETSLEAVRREGADIRICYSPTEALDRARAEPDREVVFLAIGFETTAVPLIAAARRAARERLQNFSLLTAFRRVPPVLDVLADDPALAIDAFLMPAHVSAILGADAYRPFANRTGRPCVIAGFEPLDILYGIDGLLGQARDGCARVLNQYGRVVRAGGNPRALELMREMLVPRDAAWRGLGAIPDSGFSLAPEYEAYDAEKKFGLSAPPGRSPPGCRCGDVIAGRIDPPACALFGEACVPERPIGPCMVSAEGTCAAWFRYESARTEEAS
jgi:hydrogenase expression/formation protein HypD